MIDRNQTAAAGIIGLAVGDALGVPVEFFDRERLKRHPVTGMRSFGTHNQPAGTWSDDTSLALCLAESLAEKGIDYADQAQRFIAWKYSGKWTPHGRMFDIGNATGEAITRLLSGVEPLEAGPTDERACGNGSLMRILPLAIYLAFSSSSKRWRIARECSRLTHGHVRCQLACAYYVEVAAALVRGDSLASAIIAANKQLVRVFDHEPSLDRKPFTRLLSPQFADLPASEISGSGYVIHCLEASLWCALRAKSYAEGVLAAVNLGDDTDTTGAVTEGCSGCNMGSLEFPRNGRINSSDARTFWSSAVASKLPRTQIAISLPIALPGNQPTKPRSCTPGATSTLWLAANGNLCSGPQTGPLSASSRLPLMRR